MILSEHFTLEELVFSSTAQRLRIDNSLPPNLMGALTNTARGMERVRSVLGDCPIRIDSGYRSPELNLAVGGQANSQHLKAEAVDFVCPAFGFPIDVCRALAAERLQVNFDQLIYEYDWVHVSFVADGLLPRYQVATIQPGIRTLAGLPALSKSPV
jgi:hypothetical protein